MKQFLLGIAATIAIGAIAFGAYFYGTKKNDNLPELAASPSLAPIASQLPNKQPDSSPEPSQPTKQSVDENFQAAITSKNYAALESILASQVHVRLESSGCCGMMTPSEVISQLDYLNEASGWDFGPSEIKQKLSLASEYYADPYITGVAATKQVISYKLNSENLIDAINIAATYEILVI